MGSGRSDSSATSVTAVGGHREFGRYALLDRLGSGGMADVYLALASGSFDAKKLVVLKCPRAFDHEYAQMFMDEARLAMRLNHPNVVQTYDVGVRDGSFFLAMEFLEGQPLHHLIAAMGREGRHLSHAHLARIASDALGGLHYAHELSDYDGTPLQIVHRDVSPHNVFVTYDGHVKVVDFGIAKATLNVVSTAAGSVKGKLAYMAPEHAMSGIVDRRADVFAMGIVLWEMIARRRLITGVLSSERLNRLLTMDFPPLSAEAADVHPLLEVVAMRALQRDPRDRYQTAGEMRDALEGYIGANAQPVRASEIGAMTSALFAKAREQMATRIRAHVRSTSASGPSSPTGSSAATDFSETETEVMINPGGSAPRSSPSLGEVATSHTATAVMTSPVAVPARPRPGLVAIIVLVGAASVVALTLVLFLLVRRSGPAPAQPSASDAVDASEPASALPSVLPSPQAAPPSSAAIVATGPAAGSAPAARTPATGAADKSAPPGPSARPRGGERGRRATPGTRPIDTSFPR